MPNSIHAPALPASVTSACEPAAASQRHQSGSRRLARRHDLQRRNQLVEEHLDLVRPIAFHYSRCSRESADDLRQVGLIGLIRAADLFQAGQGTPFAAFARPHIRGAILHHLRDLAPAVRLPRRQAELQERLLRLERDGLALGGAEAAQRSRDRLGIDASQWALLMRQRLLNRPGWLSDEQWQELPCPEPEADEPLDGRSRAATELATLLAGLDPRQRRVVCEVVLEGLSYRQLARRMAISPMTVQRLLQRGLDRLRTELDRRGISPLSADGPGRSAVPGC